MKQIDNRQERIQIRIDVESYNMLQRAAKLSHANLSSFIKEVSLHAAKDIIKENENMVLSDRDWNIFMNALESDAGPNEKLKKALQNYNNSTNA